jgi:hypothetical protein
VFIAKLIPAGPEFPRIIEGEIEVATVLKRAG